MVTSNPCFVEKTDAIPREIMSGQAQGHSSRLAVGREGAPVSSQLSSCKFGCFGWCLDPLFQPPCVGFAQCRGVSPPHTQPQEFRKIRRKKIILTQVSDPNRLFAAALDLMGDWEFWLRLFLPLNFVFLPCPLPLLQHLMGLLLGHPGDFFLCTAPADRRWQKHREPQFLCQIHWKITKTFKNHRGGGKQRSTSCTHSVECL